MKIRLTAFHLFFFLFFGMLLVINTTANAQDAVLDTKLKLKIKQASVPEALDEISKKTGYYFIYQAELVKDAPKVTTSGQATMLRSLIFSFFMDSSLSLKVINHHVIITKNKSIQTVNNSSLSDTTSLVTIEGTIIDAENKQSIPYAVVGLEGTSQGAISNAEGKFSLKLTNPKLSSDLKIAHIGYKSTTIHISQISAGNLTISLKRDIISLQEIVIRNQDPQKLVSQILKNANQNYPNIPARMLGFYREACSRNNQYYLISEGAVDIYKAAYDATYDQDQVKVLKSRKVYNPEVTDTLVMRLKAGLSSCLLLDLCKNPPEYMKPENLDNYDYHLDDITNLNDETVYVVSFAQKQYIKESLFCGKLYISNKNIALVAADIEINPVYVEKTRGDYVFRNKIKVKITPTRIRYRIEYRQLEHRYYLAHVRGDLDFKIKKKKNLFTSNYHVFFELAATDIDTVHSKRIVRKETEDLDGVFSVLHNGYDPNFWGNENIIEPEQPIEEALIRFSEKLKNVIAH